jgi:hypothetical protein
LDSFRLRDVIHRFARVAVKNCDALNRTGEHPIRWLAARTAEPERRCSAAALETEVMHSLRDRCLHFDG